MLVDDMVGALTRWVTMTWSAVNLVGDHRIEYSLKLLYIVRDCHLTNT